MTETDTSARNYGWPFPTKNLFPGGRNRRNNWFVPADFRLFRGTETLGIPFRTVPQRRRLLEILYHGTKIEANSRNSVLNHSAEQKTHGIPFQTVPQTLVIPFRSMSRTKTLFSILSASAGFFVKLFFFMPFSSVPSLKIDSSVNLGMPRNEHFLPRSNGSHSESIRRIFFGTKFRCHANPTRNTSIITMFTSMAKNPNPERAQRINLLMWQSDSPEPIKISGKKKRNHAFP
jgi:hypothetical protein